MSMDMMATERVCYVHCNFCNTTLAVSVPCSSLLTIVTVRCGHCANLLTVNMGASLQTFPSQDTTQRQHLSVQEACSKELGSSSKCKSFETVDHEQQPRIPPIRPPEKRQRVPSAYNRFIKEEIQRIKASNPDISHREAFSTAAKNGFCRANTHMIWRVYIYRKTSNFSFATISGHISLTFTLG
ncbi:hypothetical protein GLYMA_12G190500v4 [Glycine max]|uniref:Axial regulator YABBY 2 n=2 Tax=Glycine max TaxID=3847 RepID=A0A0R0HGY2_SOYBN|nr:protein YABBY 12 isoform X2 [Glycine max]XP_028193108.1 axial regulator YABBY 5-like isoform X4 [Glycine soja]KAH1143918.1 hypothetical protein GYH30_034237 [Glycine max]KRH26728.1 hypothetical protein GLYMA_12G190500v4 [Glycine max]|eukprot:XP_006592796.1 transcription factor YABBY12 isoform X4 [Glycine max]